MTCQVNLPTGAHFKWIMIKHVDTFYSCNVATLLYTNIHVYTMDTYSILCCNNMSISFNHSCVCRNELSNPRYLTVVCKRGSVDFTGTVYHIRNNIRVTENVIYHIRRCLKLDRFTVSRQQNGRQIFSRLINSCMIIYNNNSGMTIKTVYIPILLPPNIL